MTLDKACAAAWERVEVFTFTPEGGEGLYYCDGTGEEQPRAEAAALLWEKGEAKDELQPYRWAVP